MDAGIGPYSDVKELSTNDFRTVCLVKWEADNRNYVLKTYNKAKVMQHKSMVNNILNEK